MDTNIPKSIPITGPSTFVSVSGIEELNLANLAKAGMGGLAAFRRSVGLNAAVVRGIYMRQTMGVSFKPSLLPVKEKKKKKKIAY